MRMQSSRSTVTDSKLAYDSITAVLVYTYEYIILKHFLFLFRTLITPVVRLFLVYLILRIIIENGPFSRGHEF